MRELNRELAINLVSERMSLKLEQKEIDFFTSLELDELMIYLQSKYGENFRKNFMKHLIQVLRKIAKERKWK